MAVSSLRAGDLAAEVNSESCHGRRGFEAESDLASALSGPTVFPLLRAAQRVERPSFSPPLFSKILLR